MTSLAPYVEVRRAADRFVTTTDRLEARYSFSFGDFYDPANIGFGLLVAFNEFVVAAGAGFEPHPHRDMEVVTWVLEGALTHQDSGGHSGVIVPGQVQRLSAGRGVVHSERNLAAGVDEEVRFVQMWVVPDEPGLAPSYEQRMVDAALATGALVPVASGIGGHDGAVSLTQRHAAMHVARLPPGHGVVLPDAPYVHLFVTRGSVALDGADDLSCGDAARLTAAGARRVTGREPAEVLVWEMHAGPAATLG